VKKALANWPLWSALKVYVPKRASASSSANKQTETFHAAREAPGQHRAARPIRDRGRVLGISAICREPGNGQAAQPLNLTFARCFGVVVAARSKASQQGPGANVLDVM